MRYFFAVLLMSALVAVMPAAAIAGAEGEPGSGEEAGAYEYPDTFGPIITDTAIPVDKGQLEFQATFGLGFVTDSLSPSWRRTSAGGDFKSFFMEYQLTYGLWHNLEVVVVLPYIHNWARNVEEPGPNGESSADSGYLGDLNLTFKYLLAEEGPQRPAISALFATDFPTGRFRRLNPRHLECDVTGGGAYAFTVGLNASKLLKPFILYGNLWYTMQTAFTDDEGRQYPRDFVTVNLAAEYPITERWIALVELTSFWDAGRLIGHKANTAPEALVSLLPGIEFMATEKLALALGVNIDLAGKRTEASVTPILSAVYAF
jgi:hypothetical protein